MCYFLYFQLFKWKFCNSEFNVQQLFEKQNKTTIKCYLKRKVFKLVVFLCCCSLPFHSIDQLSEVARRHIEAGTKLQYELVLVCNAFDYNLNIYFGIQILKVYHWKTFSPPGRVWLLYKWRPSLRGKPASSSPSTSIGETKRVQTNNRPARISPPSAVEHCSIKCVLGTKYVV